MPHDSHPAAADAAAEAAADAAAAATAVAGATAAGVAFGCRSRETMRCWYGDGDHDDVCSASAVIPKRDPL